MQSCRLSLIGFGNVGRGLAQTLAARRAEHDRDQGLHVTIVADSDVRLGSVYDPHGLDPTSLLHAVATQHTLEAVDAPVRGWDGAQTIAEADAGNEGAL
jgi:homoserine dehydrogenase